MKFTMTISNNNNMKHILYKSLILFLALQEVNSRALPHSSVSEIDLNRRGDDNNQLSSTTSTITSTSTSIPFLPSQQNKGILDTTTITHLDTENGEAPGHSSSINILLSLFLISALALVVSFGSVICLKSKKSTEKKKALKKKKSTKVDLTLPYPSTIPQSRTSEVSQVQSIQTTKSSQSFFSFHHNHKDSVNNNTLSNSNSTLIATGTSCNINISHTNMINNNTSLPGNVSLQSISRLKPIITDRSVSIRRSIIIEKDYSSYCGFSPFPAPGFQFVAIYDYEPVNEDEIRLTKDDPLLISTTFEDGWIIGKNCHTEEVGFFPLSCLGIGPIDDDSNEPTNLELDLFNQMIIPNGKRRDGE